MAAVRESGNSRRKLAELTSTSGALVLGVGIGAWLAGYLRGYAVAIIVIGIVFHVFGMYDKQRIDSSAGVAQPLWSVALYWICWLALVALIIAIALGLRF